MFGLNFFLAPSSAQTDRTETEEEPAKSLPFVQPIRDPLEGINRTIGYLNHGFMMGLIDPTSRIYRLLVPGPARESVNRAGKNLAYPGRLVSNLLQGEGGDAWVETKRFGVNSTLGVAGLFDPATKMGHKTFEEDTGKAFGKWGWEPKVSLTLPLMGPSSGRDAVGTLVDTALNPATYLFPAGTIFTFNRHADTVIPYRQFTSSQYDPYAASRDLWTLSRWDKDTGFSTASEDNDAAVETLEAVLFKPNDTGFYLRRRKHVAAIPGGDPGQVKTAHELPYTVWIQRDASHLVVILPGLGSHREDVSAIALAEMVYDSGYSALTISAPMNWEFIKEASGFPVPGYPPVDVRDLRRALKGVLEDLNGRYPERIASYSLLGVSMGGFHTLLLAASEPSPGASPFQRFVAINPPVDLMYGLRKLDSFYGAPLGWPAETRDERIETALTKSAHFLTREEPPPSPLPFTPTEAKALIGMWYRLTLRDTIHSSQKKEDLGVLREPLGSLRREPSYNEIENYSFGAYYESFVKPSIRKAFPDRSDEATIRRAVDLKSATLLLVNDSRIRVFANENDFLLAGEDVEWLRATFGDRLKMNRRGGHLGNLHRPSARSAVLSMLSDR